MKSCDQSRRIFLNHVTKVGVYFWNLEIYTDFGHVTFGYLPTWITWLMFQNFLLFHFKTFLLLRSSSFSCKVWFTTKKECSLAFNSLESMFQFWFILHGGKEPCTVVNRIVSLLCKSRLQATGTVPKHRLKTLWQTYVDPVGIRRTILTESAVFLSNLWIRTVKIPDKWVKKPPFPISPSTRRLYTNPIWNLHLTWLDKIILQMVRFPSSGLLHHFWILLYISVYVRLFQNRICLLHDQTNWNGIAADRFKFQTQIVHWLA